MHIYVSFLLILRVSFLICVSPICSDTPLDTSIAPPPTMSSENNPTNWTVFELSNETDARCLDGSSYKFLKLQGFGNGIRKFLFFFPGGGFCGYENLPFLDSCLQRSQSTGGSSDMFGENGTTYQTQYYLSYFSSDKEINPLFADWNKIMLIACDGTFFQGYQKDPIIYNGSELYFRGYNNTKETFKFLSDNQRLFDAEEVVLMGISSGAQALLIWIEYLRNYLPRNIILSGLTDAGLFLDVKNQNANCYLFRKHIMEIANFTNSQFLDLFDNCSYQNNSKKIYKCLIPEYFVGNISVDLFMVNSQNDYEVLRGPYGLQCLSGGLENCSQDIDIKIWKYREKFLRIALNLKKNKKSWGFWLRRCLEHYYAGSQNAWEGNFTVYSAESREWKNIREAFYSWYQNRNVNVPDFIDLSNWEADCPVFPTS